jgi:hypothetical protein
MHATYRVSLSAGLLFAALSNASAQPAPQLSFRGHAMVEVIANGQTFRTSWDFTLQRAFKYHATKTLWGKAPCPDPKGSICTAVEEEWSSSQDMGAVRIGDGAALVNIGERVAETIWASRKRTAERNERVPVTWIDNVRRPTFEWRPRIIGTRNIDFCPESFPVAGCSAKVSIEIEDLATKGGFPEVAANTTRPSYRFTPSRSPVPGSDLSFVEFRYYRCEKGTWDRTTKVDGTMEKLRSAKPTEAVFIPTSHALRQGCDPDAKFNVNMRPDSLEYQLAYLGNGHWEIPLDRDPSRKAYPYESKIAPEFLSFGNGKFGSTLANAWRAAKQVSGPFGTVMFPEPTGTLASSNAAYAVRSSDGSLYLFRRPVVW